MPTLQEEVYLLANAALSDPNGAAIIYEVPTSYPTKEECKRRCKVIRSNFHALKQKTRKVNLRLYEDQPHLLRGRTFQQACDEYVGEFDELSTSIDETEKGWQIRFVKGFTSSGVNGRIVSLTTGEPIKLLT
jgi:hypothetical protein